MTTVEFLRKARSNLVERGWWHGGLGGPGGEVCAKGALLLCPGDVAVYEAAYVAFLSAVGLRRASKGGPCRIPAWNDAPGRTKDEVLAAFTRAILHEEAKAAALAPVVATPDRVGVA